MTDIRMDVIDLLLDCTNFGTEAYLAGELRHTDGTRFTEEEHAKVGTARRTELEAMARFSKARADWHEQILADHQALATLTEPYFIAYDKDGATLQDIREVMTVADREKLDEIMDRIAVVAAMEAREHADAQGNPRGQAFEDHVFIYVDELQGAIEDAEGCGVCGGGLGLHIEFTGEWTVVQIHALNCSSRGGKS